MILKPGQTHIFAGIEIRLALQNHIPQKILAQPKLPVTTIEIGSDLDTEDIATQRLLCDMIFAVAKAVAPKLILEPAQNIATVLGVAPARWRISKARKRALGTCDSLRTVSFSPLLVFLPREMRLQIICHELAHLTHLDHSPLFHKLCNDYTLRITGHPEAYFKRKLKEMFRQTDSLLALLIQRL